MDANTLLRKMKVSIDELWQTYGNTMTQDTLVYAKNEYGVMQHSELMEIMDLLGHLKKRVDGLTEDCREIPQDMQNTA